MMFSQKYSLEKKVEWKKECFQGLDHKYKNWEKKILKGGTIKTNVSF